MPLQQLMKGPIDIGAEWQRPFEDYGGKTWQCLQGVSNPNGLFERGSRWVLGVVDDEA